MLVILLNCVTLGMFHPCEDIACDSPRCRILQVLRGGEDWAGSSPAGAVSHDGRSCLHCLCCQHLGNVGFGARMCSAVRQSPCRAVPAPAQPSLSWSAWGRPTI